MNDRRRARNCARCKIRQLSAKYLERRFDYTNCPFICLKNKIDYHGTGIIKNPRPFI